MSKGHVADLCKFWTNQLLCKCYGPNLIVYKQNIHVFLNSEYHNRNSETWAGISLGHLENAKRALPHKAQSYSIYYLIITKNMECCQYCAYESTMAFDPEVPQTSAAVFSWFSNITFNAKQQNNHQRNLAFSCFIARSKPMKNLQSLGKTSLFFQTFWNTCKYKKRYITNRSLPGSLFSRVCASKGLLS